MTLYERIEQACKPKNLTPTGRELEKLMRDRDTSFSRTTVNKWRDGTMPKSCAIVAELANVLNVSSDYLLCRTDDPTDYATEGNDLTESERHLIQMIRRLDKSGIESCMQYIEYTLFKQGEDGKRANTAG